MADVDEIWGDDLLGFKSRGDAFTNLVTSITDHRTISIEAGYGRGKTFFRKRWAMQLRAAGECVVEIDARLSDHSGDPVVTFLGALLGLVPEKQNAKRAAAFAATKKIAIAGTKAVAKAALREGFDDIAGALQPEDGDAGTLQDIAKTAGKDLSKAAGEMIAAQLSAEKARKELGEQLKTLHAQITEGRETDRIVILIDELDRCHPDYAIALLEAMKLVFDQNGFVFVLMVNREYLEKVAAHRFGELEDGEFYLDKFVDLRLKIEVSKQNLQYAVRVLFLDLPLTIPFGDHKEFSIKRAAAFAAQLATGSELSIRQIMRIRDRIELVLRIYTERPIDTSLLVWLAFLEASPLVDESVGKNLLPRLKLTPSEGTRGQLGIHDQTILNLSEFSQVSNSTMRSPDSKLMKHHTRLYEYLAPHYIPDHQAMLDAVHELQADP